MMTPLLSHPSSAPTSVGTPHLPQREIPSIASTPQSFLCAF
jgi:hypothetical protein